MTIDDIIFDLRECVGYLESELVDIIDPIEGAYLRGQRYAYLDAITALKALQEYK